MKFFIFLLLISFFTNQTVKSNSLVNRPDLGERKSLSSYTLIYFYDKTNYLKVIDFESLAEFNKLYKRNYQKNVFIIHGWQSGFVKDKWITEFKDNIFDRENDVNVFIVDWFDLAKKLNYKTCALQTRFIAKEIAGFIEYLLENFSIDLDQVHVIGHSLGAQTAGFIGKNLKEKKLEIGKISGLDPAGPLFTKENKNDRIDRTDANYVEVLHTNMALNLALGLGSIIKSGDKDIFLNGGSRQRSCIRTNFYQCYDDFYKNPDIAFYSSNQKTIISKKEPIVGEVFSNIFVCDHGRALDYFKETIKENTCEPVAYQCDSYKNYLDGACSDCGENNEKCHLYGYSSVNNEEKFGLPKGIPYFLETNSKLPLCAFHYQLIVERKEITDFLPYEFEIFIEGTNGSDTIYLKKKLDHDFITSLVTTKEYLGEILKAKVTKKHVVLNGPLKKECLISSMNFKFMSSMDKEKREKLSSKLCLVDCQYWHSYFEKC